MPGLCGNWLSLLRIGSATGIAEILRQDFGPQRRFFARNDPKRGRARSANGSRVSEETKETRSDSVLPWQLIARQPHPGEGSHSIETVIPLASRLIPHWDGDINLLE